MRDEVAIEIKNVSKNFILPHEKITTVKSAFTGLHKMRKKSKSVQHALRDVTFEVNKGEFFGIVGRNGSGKSTLLKMLAGIYQPTHGSIVTHGKLVPFIELGVGFNPELTGRENVYLNGAMMGFSPKETNAMYDDIVAFAELEEFMDQKLKNYSSGMQVRLAFSVAIKAEADILLVDEVLAVGDADFMRKCYQYFKSLKKNKKTVVFVSHDMNAVREYCDRAALIENSRLVDIGQTGRIADKYQELFLVERKVDKNLNKLSENKRMGSGVAQIDAAELSKSIYSDKDSELELSIGIKLIEPTDKLMVGFSVKSALGEYINSSHSWEKIPDLAELVSADKVNKVIWTIPNIYEDGTYTIDVYLKGDHNELYDRLDDALTFHVKRAVRSGALVAVESKVEVI